MELAYGSRWSEDIAAARAFKQATCARMQRKIKPLRVDTRFQEPEEPRCEAVTGQWGDDAICTATNPQQGQRVRAVNSPITNKTRWADVEAERVMPENWGYYAYHVSG